jgi:hypothetical protein
MEADTAREKDADQPVGAPSGEIGVDLHRALNGGKVGFLAGHCMLLALRLSRRLPVASSADSGRWASSSVPSRRRADDVPAIALNYSLSRWTGDAIDEPALRTGRSAGEDRRSCRQAEEASLEACPQDATA